jgi:hypothetical protein
MPRIISRLDEMVMNMNILCSLKDRMIGNKNMVLHRFTGYRHNSYIRATTLHDYMKEYLGVLFCYHC